MTEMTEADRKAFEAWYAGANPDNVPWHEDDYLPAWQAAIAHARGKQEPVQYADLHGSQREWELRSVVRQVHGAHGIINGVIQADLVSAILGYEATHPAESEEVARLRKALEPFALISTEGVIKAKDGHVTVVTCAGYFHQAAAALAASPAPVADTQAPENTGNAACCEQKPSKPTGDDLLKALEDECWDLRCVNVPTGGDDYDVEWRVISHWQAKPHERIQSQRNTPRAALIAAIEGGEDE